uniref:Reverse transcriptase domain-containing protein n=1 Tax=Tanacetum cinerariifolium TaxID=118510 RepID=A0A6L2KLP5_TANCI|nr:hypothetical protein [Tanacetum cinerariifolium]
MFKQLHISITLADALILIPKYQKMLKALLSNKEKLLELENTPLNENCLAVILNKLPEKLGDPGKFLIPCGFNKLKCKALADLDNRAICTPAGIERDVFVLVGKFTFLADFVIVDYESDLRVPLILGRPFLRTACALIDVHGEEMILHDGDERLTLNMRHDTSSYSSQPQKESINLINICDDSNEDFLEELCARNFQSGNPTFSSHPKLTLSEVKNDSDTSLSFLEYETFLNHTKETNSGSTTTHADYSLPNTTIHADISLLDLECFNFDFKPEPGELTSIVDSGICKNILSATNANFPPEEDHYPLFAYFVWIFISFLTFGRLMLKDFVLQSSFPQLHSGII